MSTPSLFTRFVEPGRLALVRYGPLEGKIATIVDIQSLNRVVIDGPTTGVKRQVIPIKWISLTGQCLKNCGRGMTEKILKKRLAAEGTVEAWNKTKWAKKLKSMEAKKSLTDLERFKLMLARKKVKTAVKKATKPAKKK